MSGDAHGLSAFSNGDLPPPVETRPLVALSESLVQCAPPVLYGVGRYQVELLQNGGAVDPTASGTPITFELYDLTEVFPTDIEPRGGPLGEPVAGGG